MAKKILIKKISLDEIIDVFVDLYNKGVDYVDIVSSEDEENKLKVIFTKEYMCKEMQDVVEDVEQIDDEDEEDDSSTTFSADDINDLI